MGCYIEIDFKWMDTLKSCLPCKKKKKICQAYEVPLIGSVTEDCKVHDTQCWLCSDAAFCSIWSGYVFFCFFFRKRGIFGMVGIKFMD